MATAAAALSRDWVHRAKQSGDDAVQQLEEEVDECLMDCCAKDVRQQAFEKDLTAQLARLDPTRAATHARQIGRAPPATHLTAAPPQTSAHTAVDPRDADADLQELRAQKLASMQTRQGQARAVWQQGYGQLRDVSSAQAEELLFGRDVPAVVCHLWLPGLAADLDEALYLLALEHRGTRVVRCPASHAAPLLRRLRRPEGAWLVAARHGRILGVAAADGDDVAVVRGDAPGGVRRSGRCGSGDESSDFGSSDGEEADWVRFARPASPSFEQCMPGAATVLSARGSWLSSVQVEGATTWLKRLGVLRTQPPAPAGAQADHTAADSSGDEGDAARNELGDPCPICGRTYYHVHKRAVRQGGADGCASE